VCPATSRKCWKITWCWSFSPFIARILDKDYKTPRPSQRYGTKMNRKETILSR
jgi:hypothetical protein